MVFAGLWEKEGAMLREVDVEVWKKKAGGTMGRGLTERRVFTNLCNAFRPERG